MNEALKLAAQDVMDIYYQDFKTDDAFFDIDDFAEWIGKVYADEANNTAKLIYQTSRSELGVGYITFSQDWWVSKTFKVDVKFTESYAYVPIDIEYLGFEYDNQESGIQDVKESGKGRGGVSLIRTTLLSSWKLKHQPFTSRVFWYVEDKEIVLFSKKACFPKEIKVWYIPTADDPNFKLPSSKKLVIAQRAWALMKQAETGTVIDTTNDQNPNVAAQTEINPSTINPAIR